jgi:hypothetical protein
MKDGRPKRYRWGSRGQRDWARTLAGKPRQRSAGWVAATPWPVPAAALASAAQAAARAGSLRGVVQCAGAPRGSRARRGASAGVLRCAGTLAAAAAGWIHADRAVLLR